MEGEFTEENNFAKKILLLLFLPPALYINVFDSLLCFSFHYSFSRG